MNRGVCVVVALGLIAVARPAIAKPDRIQRVVPKKKTLKERRAARRSTDQSRGGERNGTLQFVVGGAAAAVAAVLIGRGIWELVEGKRLADACAAGESNDAVCEAEDPYLGPKVAAGLSFGFAVPIGIGSGFLVARAVRINRDYRMWHGAKTRRQLSLHAHVGRAGVGLRFRIRF